MFRFSFFAIGLSALAPVVSAQTFEWSQPRAFDFSRNTGLIRSSVALAPDGSGWWVSPEDYRASSTGETLGALHLTRLRPDGTPARQLVAQGTASVLSLRATPDGGVLLLGEYKDSLIYDAAHRYVSPHPNSGIEFFVTALDSVGAVRWHRALRPTAIPTFTSIQNANALALDPRGGTAWVGYDTYGDGFATRLDLATGDSLTTLVQRGTSIVSSIAIDPAGTVYVAGSCAHDTADFNGTRVGRPAGFEYNTYVACYSPAGILRWANYGEDITCETAVAVATADTGGVYFTGPLNGAARFGTLQATGISAGFLSSFFLTRLDHATGTFQWLRQAPLPAGSSPGDASPAFEPLALDAAGNAWLLLTTRGNLPWPGFSPALPPSFGGATLLAYDIAGTLRTVAVAAGESSSGHALTIDPTTNRGVIAGLARTGAAQFGALPALPAVPTGRTQVFTVSFQATLAPMGIPTEAAEMAGLYPNPVAPNGRVQFDAPSGACYEVLDALGRRVGGGEVAASFAAPLRRGLYLLRLQPPAGRPTTHRLVVE